MGVIQRLPTEVIDRIAAGEVIERPASVAKELLENALDAGARQITVELTDGGLRELTISDDGSGMSEEDAHLAVERHATSKLSLPEDLFAIRTFGFRGEALSSIAAISRLTLTTRTPDAEAALRLVWEGGHLLESGSAGAPLGTTLRVENLFFNTPARRKFMRAASTEQAHVLEACVRVMLGEGRAGLVLLAEGRRLLDVPPDDGTVAGAAERIQTLMRRRVRRVFAFDHRQAGVAVSGHLAGPDENRGDAKGMWFFVNGRAVRDRTLQRALLDGYGAILPRGRYPLAVVHVQLDPATVDVNVHPQKLEVRFADSRAVYRAVNSAAARAVSATPWSLDERVGGAAGAPEPQPFSGPGPGTVWTFDPPAAPLAFESASREVGYHGGVFLQSADLGEIGGFRLVRVRGRVWVVDARALRAERCRERLRREHAQGEVSSRRLLFPQGLELAERTLAELPRLDATLREIGFEIEAVGPRRVALVAAPAALPSETGLRALAERLLVGALQGADLNRLIELCAEHAASSAASEHDASGALGELNAVLEGGGDPSPWARPLGPEVLARLFVGGGTPPRDATDV